MKKILAGVLAAASMLAVSATAFATDTKAVKAPGDVEYDVTVGAPKVVLDLVMPAKLAAALNPYGANIVMTPEVKADATATPPVAAVAEINTTKGIGSVTYKVTNNSVDYGVFIDATAITTVETTDATKWTVKPAAVVDGTKGAQLALIAAKSNAAATMAPTSQPTASATWAEASGGVLVMDSTVAADKTKNLAAGQTNQKKFAYVAAATVAGDVVTPADIYMGFTGVLAKDATGKEVVWNDDDAINVQLVLKVTAGPKTFA